MSSRRDSYCIVGAGIVGLALARELLIRCPDLDLTVLEKEQVVGAHQTGHNSGVVHAGIYYAPGSLKATLCQRGGSLLREFCQEQKIEIVECGKLVIASRDEELDRLKHLQERAELNKVVGLRYLRGDQITEIEPHAVGVAALHSPHTAIVDYGAVARALAADIAKRGGRVIVNAEVTGFGRQGSKVRVSHRTGEVIVEHVVTCAGLQADQVGELAGDTFEPEVLPFRGEYLRLRPSAAELIRGLIYPVPDPRFPFLGIHIVRRIDGSVELGPNAVLSFSREGYRRRDIDPSSVVRLLRSTALRNLLRRHWKMALREGLTSLSMREFVRQAQRLLPELSMGDVVRAPSGVRAQAVAPSGDLVDDFVINHFGPISTVRNAPSPAATSSLAIAEHLCDSLGVG